MLALLWVAAFAALLLWAAACDVATMEIPNRISIIAVALYPIAALTCGASLGAVGVNLLVGFCALLITWGLFSLGVFGGGDAKIIAAAAVWTGPLIFIKFLLWTCIAGGGLAMLALSARRQFHPANGYPAFVNRFLSETGVPYAVAIAAGGIAVLGDLPILHAAAF